MANKLDLSLDDIGGGGRGRGGRGRGRGGRRSGGGGDMPSDKFVNPLSRDEDDDVSPSSFAPERRGRNQGGRSRAAPYSRPSSNDGLWRRDLGRNGAGAAASSGPKKLTTRTAQGLASKRILITNLDGEVTEEDVRDIFEQAGDLTSVVVNADENGNSKGTANVVFAKPSQAAAAVKDFDGAEVDGRPMYLRLVDAQGNSVNPAAASAAAPERQQRRVVQQNQNGNGNFRPRANSGGGSKESLFGSALNNLDYDDDFGSFSNGGGGGGFRRGGARRGRGGGGNRGGGFNNYQQRNSRGGRGGNRGGGGNRGRGRGGKGGGKGNKQETATAEDLDAEMDAYFNSKDTSMAE